MPSLELKIIQPSKEVKPLVRRILITKSDGPVKEKLPIGPTGYSYLTYSRYPLKLVFSNKVIESDKQLYIAGQLDNETPYFEIEGRFFHVGLELLPTAPSYLFGVNGIVDGGVILEDIDKELSDIFRNTFAKEEDPEKVARGLEDIIIEKIPKVDSEDKLDRSLDLIYANSGHLEVAHLAEKVGISQRHLRRLFKQYIGIGPKKYSKIIQLNTAFEAIQQGNEKNIAEHALKNGYFDQAHFINDFKSLLGESPSRFLKSNHDFLKHYLGAK